jgi:hypothetical protein
MGTTDELSVDILLNMLNGFSKDFKYISQIIIGGDNTDLHRPNRRSRVKGLFNHIKETRYIRAQNQPNSNNISARIASKIIMHLYVPALTLST